MYSIWKMSKAKDYIFVTIQLLLFGVFFYLMTFQNTNASIWLKVFSGILTLVGVILLCYPIYQLNRHITMLPTPTANAKLITGGAFKYIRHPIYAGILFGGSGVALYTNNFNQLMVVMLLSILFNVKTDYEETQLIKKFPEYKIYQSKTGKFFPTLLMK